MMCTISLPLCHLIQPPQQYQKEILRLIAELRPDAKENRSNRAPGAAFGDPPEGDRQEPSQTFRIEGRL
jgi:hypothetical protein